MPLPFIIGRILHRSARQLVSALTEGSSVGMVPFGQDLNLYASAISCLVGSFGSVWANEKTLIGASTIAAEIASFTALFYVVLRSAVTSNWRRFIAPCSRCWWG